MSASVYIPTPYREATGGKSQVMAEGTTVLEVLKSLGDTYPDLKERLLTPEGQIPGYLSVYVGDEEVRNLQGDATPVKDGDEISLIPAMAGGSGPALTEEQLERYSRQVILPEVGTEGQKKLLSAKVAVVGAGGLGAPVLMYLAAAGVGTLGVIDGDRVERSNLHRQPIHSEADLGRSKALSALSFIKSLNPDVRVLLHEEILSSENAMEILKGYDLIVNGSDNFPTRYLVNDAAYLLGKPLVDASILRFEGQATVFRPGDGCYRCLFPEPPAAGTVPSCSEGGVMGALAGQMGTLQAMEALKLILGVGEPLTGRLLVYDALSGRTRLLKWHRDPNCPLCGDHPTITGLIDYEAFCGVALPRRGVDFAEETHPWDLSPEEAATLLKEGSVQFVDVRAKGQHLQGTVPGARSIPLWLLEGEVSSLDPEKPVVFFCEVGQKSALAAEMARDLGLQAKSVKGGLVAWRNLNLPWEETA